MANRQKQKGDRYERELAAYFNEHAYQGRDQCGRAPLSGGGFVGLTGGADLVGTTGLFVEAKRVEKLNFLDALKQAEGNAIKTHSPETPIVINRRNNMSTGESLVLLRLDEFLKYYTIWLEANGYNKSKPKAPQPLAQFKPSTTGQE